jgi:hypothetical protein
MFPQLNFWRLFLQGFAFEIGFWFLMTLIGLTPQTRDLLQRTFYPWTLLEQDRSFVEERNA